MIARGKINASIYCFMASCILGASIGGLCAYWVRIAYFAEDFDANADVRGNTSGRRKSGIVSKQRVRQLPELLDIEDQAERIEAWIDAIAGLVEKDWRKAAKIVIEYPGDRMNPSFTDQMVGKVIKAGGVEALSFLISEGVNFYALQSGIAFAKPDELLPYVNALSDSGVYQPLGCFFLKHGKPSDWDSVERKLLVDAKLGAASVEELVLASRFTASVDPMVFAEIVNDDVAAMLAGSSLGFTTPKAPAELIKQLEDAVHLPGQSESTARIRPLSCMGTAFYGDEAMLLIGAEQGNQETRATIYSAVFEYSAGAGGLTPLIRVLTSANLRKNEELVRLASSYAEGRDWTSEEVKQMESLASRDHNLEEFWRTMRK